MLESAAQLDRADAGDRGAGRLIRVLTPLAKYTLCKQTRQVTGEAMEIRGGKGYIEDWINPRLLRDAHLGSIWEGSSHVIALDVLRCLRRENAHHTLAETYLTRLAEIDLPEAAGSVTDLRSRWEAVCSGGDELLTAPDEEQQVHVAGFVEQASRTIMATLLTEHAGEVAHRGHGYRALLVAETYLQRLSTPGTISSVALAHLGELVDGGHLPAPART